MRLSQSSEVSKGLRTGVKQREKQTDQSLDRIVDASNGSVILAREKRIPELERERVLAEVQLPKVVSLDMPSGNRSYTQCGSNQEIGI